VEIAQCDRSFSLDGIEVIALRKPKNRIYRFFVTSFQLLRTGLKENCDLYHFHDPELIPVGIALKILGKKVIFDVHEDLHETIAYKKWIPSFGRSILKGLVLTSEYISGVFFDRIITATKKIAKRFPESKTTVIYNYPILDELVVQDSLPQSDREKTCVYVGGISPERGFYQMVDAIGKSPNVTLNVVGQVNSPDFQRYISEKNLEDQVFLVGRQDRNEVANYLNKAKLGLVLLHPTQNHFWSYPIKMFEYMSIGLPVIASDFPQWREIIEKSDCGLLVDPLNVDEVVSAIDLIVNDDVLAKKLGENGRKAILSTYNWAMEEVKLLDLYEKIFKHD
jgi:glycosyltransferase involved in cell wall biosynthesis